jgi:hypothetical protein
MQARYQATLQPEQLTEGKKTPDAHAGSKRFFARQDFPCAAAAPPRPGSAGDFALAWPWCAAQFSPSLVLLDA